MNPDTGAFANIDRLVHEPSRAIILSVLAAVESADFIYLARETQLTRGNLSVHLSNRGPSCLPVIRRLGQALPNLGGDPLQIGHVDVNDPVEELQRLHRVVTAGIVDDGHS